MKINNFSMTKNQYDHICQLINNSSQARNGGLQRRSAILYVASICKANNGSKRILNLGEMLDIVKKIQTKLGYKP